MAADRLRRFTGPFVLRRLKTDRSIITDLPEKLEMEVLTNLTAEQASLYQAVVDDMLAKIDAADGIERRGLVLATMTEPKQVCNHPAHFLRDGSPLAGRSGKLERLDEILARLLGRWASGRCCSPSTRSSGRCCAATSRVGSAARSSTCTAGWRVRAGGDGDPLPVRRGRRHRCSCCR